MKWLLAHFYHFISGVFLSIIGYFAPMKDVLHVVLIAIIIDLFFGLIAARAKGEGIKSFKLWRTVYKMLFAVILISLVYSIDKEMGMFELHKIIAWGIAGFEVWSILESMGAITDHKLFGLLKHIMTDKVKDVTGVNLEEETK
jgi:phage-related holin